MIESHFFEIPRAAGLSGAVQSGNVYSSPEKLNEIPIRVGSKEYTMIGWGEDNQLPYQIKELIDFCNKIDSLLASGYNPKLDDGVGKNIAPLQKAGIISYNVLKSTQLPKYLNADW